MLQTIAITPPDPGTPDPGTAAVRLAILLILALGTGFVWYRMSTASSRKRAAEIQAPGIEGGVPMAPPPVTFGDLEAAVAEGADLSALTTLQPPMTALELLRIARESFALIRKARAERIPGLADGLLAPDLRARLDADVAADTEARRHHLYPMLDIAGATILGCVARGDATLVTVRFNLTGAEVERDDDTGEVVSGQAETRQWDERWTLGRDSGDGGEELDRQMTHTAGGWLIPHRAWTVRAVEVDAAPTMHDDAAAPAAPRVGTS